MMIVSDTRAGRVDPSNSTVQSKIMRTPPSTSSTDFRV